jgi:type I restriction enzyme S subunit
MVASKPSAEQLITENIDVWTSAIKKRSSQGRGSSKKIELYGIKKLRALILELAVRGLLVPQDPTDEPASVLLEKIAAEREQLIENGEIKKQKSLLDITEKEKTFELPIGWQWVRLGTLFNSIMSGGTPSKGESTYWGGDIPWASVKDLGSERYISSTQDYITKEGLDAGSKLSATGDVLICTRMGLGKIAIASVPIAINQDLKAVKLSSKVNVEYFLNTYSTLKIKGTGTTVAGIKQEELLNYVIGLPPELEHPRIIAKVNELMALCDQLEQQTESSLSAHQTLVETLLNTLLTAAQTTGTKESSSQSNSNQESSFDQAWNRIAQHFDVLFTTEHSIDQLKQTILQLAVMGKLVPQDPSDEPASVLLEKIAAEKEQLIKDKKIKKQKALSVISQDEKPFDLPQGWKWARFGDLFQELKYGTSQKSDYQIKGCPVLRIPNVVKGLVDSTDLKFSDLPVKDILQYSLEAGDLLQIRSNGSASIVGTGSIVDKAHEGFAYAGYLVRVRFVPATCNSYFLLQALQSKLVRRQIEGPLRTTSGVKNINSTEISNLLIPFAPLSEQSRIVAKVDELMALCDSLKERISESQSTQLNLADSMAEQALN